MKQTKEMKQAIDYLKKHWPEGHKDQIKAMCLLALAQIGGRSEMNIINRGTSKC